MLTSYSANCSDPVSTLYLHKFTTLYLTADKINKIYCKDPIITLFVILLLVGVFIFK